MKRGVFVGGVYPRQADQCAEHQFSNASCMMKHFHICAKLLLFIPTNCTNVTSQNVRQLTQLSVRGNYLTLSWRCGGCVRGGRETWHRCHHTYTGHSGQLTCSWDMTVDLFGTGCPKKITHSGIAYYSPPKNHHYEKTYFVVCNTTYILVLCSTTGCPQKNFPLAKHTSTIAIKFCQCDIFWGHPLVPFFHSGAFFGAPFNMQFH